VFISVSPFLSIAGAPSRLQAANQGVTYMMTDGSSKEALLTTQALGVSGYPAIMVSTPVCSTCEETCEENHDVRARCCRCVHTNTTYQCNSSSFLSQKCQYDSISRVLHKYADDALPVTSASLLDPPRFCTHCITSFQLVQKRYCEMGYRLVHVVLQIRICLLGVPHSHLMDCCQALHTL